LELATFYVLGGVTVEHICEKNKKMKKNVDDHRSTHKKKIEKEKKSRAKKMVYSKKCMFLSKIKRQIVILFYPSCLNQGRKDAGALMFIRNP